MNTTLLKEKEILAKGLSINLEQVRSEIEALKAKKDEQKDEVFTERQLNFPKDDAAPICAKYWNKHYRSKKSEILYYITKKFERVKKQKEKTDAKYLIFEKFFEDYKKEQAEIFTPEKELF